MSYNGSGSFSINTSGQPVVATTLIEAAVFNAFTADIATGLSTCLLKDGTQTVTANIPMAGYVFTGLGSGNANRGYSARTGDVQDNLANWCGTAGGTKNALTLTPTPAITAYVAGQSFTFKSGTTASDSTVTVAVSGLSAIAVQVSGAALSAGEIQASKWYRITLDTTSTCQLEPITGPTLSGAYPVVLTATAATNVTLPTSGTLSTLVAASQAEQETGSSTAVAVTPGRQQFHASATKGWVYFDGTSGSPTAAASYNVTSITKNGTGDFSINWTVAMSSTNYCGNAMSTMLNSRFSTSGTVFGTTAMRVQTLDSTPSLSDSAYTCAQAWGDQ